MSVRMKNHLEKTKRGIGILVVLAVCAMGHADLFASGLLRFDERAVYGLSYLVIGGLICLNITVGTVGFEPCPVKRRIACLLLPALSCLFEIAAGNMVASMYAGEQESAPIGPLLLVLLAVLFLVNLLVVMYEWREMLTRGESVDAGLFMALAALLLCGAIGRVLHSMAGFDEVGRALRFTMGVIAVELSVFIAVCLYFTKRQTGSEADC